MAKKKTGKLPVKVIKYLEKNGINHEILEHKTIYTAIDAANTLKKKMNEIAKSLIVKADKDYFLVLLPADKNLDFKKLGTCLGAQTGKKFKVIKIPGEKIMEKSLKIKAGALSAFGNIHKVPVVMEKGLSKIKKAVFSSGSLNHSVEMGVKEFINMEEAILGSFGVKKKIKKQPKAKKKTIKKIKQKPVASKIKKQSKAKKKPVARKASPKSRKKSVSKKKTSTKKS
jgi:prolyl-tRNA editing enzyme YbaK/EbsC (Cys-tRNA(Pro) deacylase)